MTSLARTNLWNRRRLVLALLCVWMVTSAVIIYRIQNFGAYASMSVTKALDYTREHRGDPGSVRLNQSYSQWALALNLSDAANYIKTGLGFSEGKGISLRNISPDQPDSKEYLAYYFQSPGTPIVIGMMIRLFGEQSVLPYFIFILIVHFITTILTCVLASRFVEEDAYIFGAGVLSLLCLPVLDFDFAAGLFSSEPLAAPFIVLALIALSNFWIAINKGDKNKIEIDKGDDSYKGISFKSIGLNALLFGASIAVAAYFRDIYTIFAQFSLLVLFVFALIKKAKLKQILFFILISSVILYALEYPWKKRNQRYFNEFTMSGATYYGYMMWHTIWDDYKESDKWSWNAGLGLGNYLAPQKSAEVTTILDKNKQAGSVYALQELIKAICLKPWDAACFKLGVYDTLWFGQRCHWHIYLWCLVSTISFIVFVYLTRFKFIPELWLFPLFLFSVSPLIHYEHRYSEPFFLFVTPITAMYVLRHFFKR